MGNDAGLWLCLFGVPALLVLAIAFRRSPAENITKHIGRVKHPRRFK